jgi:hypothetical protein
LFEELSGGVSQFGVAQVPPSRIIQQLSSFVNYRGGAGANLLGQLLGPSLGQFLPPQGGHNVLYSGGANNLELRRNNVNF